MLFFLKQEFSCVRIPIWYCLLYWDILVLMLCGHLEYSINLRKVCGELIFKKNAGVRDRPELPGIRLLRPVAEGPEDRKREQAIRSV